MSNIGNRCRLLCVFLLLVISGIDILAQNADRAAREALWNSYKLPEGKLNRHLDKKNGLSFRVSAEWKVVSDQNVNSFSSADYKSNIVYVSEAIPEGIGTAPYAAALLQSARKEWSLEPELVVMRTIRAAGVEWNEISYNIPEKNNLHQTIWVTTNGTFAYSFILTSQSNYIDKAEPVLKGVISSVRLAGYWNEEFELLREKILAEVVSSKDVQFDVSHIIELYRGGRESFESASEKLSNLYKLSPESVIDYVTDTDPQVRIVAITAIGKSSNGKNTLNDLMMWLIKDQDTFVATTASQFAFAHETAEGIESKLVKLVDNIPALVRCSTIINQDIVTRLIDKFLASDNPKEHMAALQMALVKKDFNGQLPFEKLLSSNDQGILYALVAILKRHPAPTHVDALKKFLGSGAINEKKAVYALGIIGSNDLVDYLKGQLDVIDKKLELSYNKEQAAKKSRTAKKRGTSSKTAKVKSVAKETFDGPPPPPAPMLQFAYTEEQMWEKSNETTRLAFIRGEIDGAIRKIQYRDRWNKVSSYGDRNEIEDEIQKYGMGLVSWYQNSLSVIDPDKSTLNETDIVSLQTQKNIPTTGETIFPKDTISYLTAPNIARSLEKFDSALSGIKMPTVLDQMTSAAMLKIGKAKLASMVGVEMTGDASTSLGFDLNAPISMALWYSANGKHEVLDATTVRVTDRMRFERTLANIQSHAGDSREVVYTTTLISRFGGLMTSSLPAFVGVYLSATQGSININYLNFPAESKIPSLKSFSYVIREQIGNLPVTQIINPIITIDGGAKWQMIYVVYINETAIVTSSRNAIVELSQSIASGETISSSDGYKAIQTEKGEVRFFSRLNKILDDSTIHEKESAYNKKLRTAITSAIGIESGSFQISDNSLETAFKLGIPDSELFRSLKPFSVDQLTAPGSILPKSTLVYAGTIIDPPAFQTAIKNLGKNFGLDKNVTEDDKTLNELIDRVIVPNMQGEISAAVLSLTPILRESKLMPSMVLLVKLKKDARATIVKDIKDINLIEQKGLFEINTVFKNPIWSLSVKDDAPIITIISDYLVFADSLDSLLMLDSKETLDKSDDYIKSRKGVPQNLSLYLTYNFDSVLNGLVTKGGDVKTQAISRALSAYTNATHSKKAFLTTDNSGVSGKLSVSFDRDGRYSIGEIANSSGNIDLLNAEIIPAGQIVLNSTKLEAMTMKIKGKSPGMGQRLREDLSGNDFQKVDVTDDTSVVVNVSARHIPKDLTISLPVHGAEFLPYLMSSGSIRTHDPRIIQMASEIVGNDKDGRSVARKIGEWTYKNLKWKRVDTNSVQTLASREADCLEHAELYVSLARSVDLPARVITGFAMSGGGFGAHAWVEVYLGRWVEFDPTWGLMDHVDASHIRFNNLSPVHYVMLNQLQFDITSIRRQVADFQRDPIRLVKEFAASEDTYEVAFDLTLTAERMFGRDGLKALDDKQRSAITTAFNKQVKVVSEDWVPFMKYGIPHILQNEIIEDTARITVLYGYSVYRLTLIKRDSAWYIVEHEDTDDQWPLFKDALNGSIKPDQKRGYALTAPVELAHKHVDKLIIAEGETAELMLLKSRVMKRQQQEEALSDDTDDDDAKSTEKKTELPDPATEYLKKIVEKYPTLASVKYELADDLLTRIRSQENPDPQGGDVKLFFKELNEYQKLSPYDSRAWHRMAEMYEALKKDEDAAIAYQKTITMVPANMEYHQLLINNYVKRNLLEKAEPAFANMLKLKRDDDDVYGYFQTYGEEIEKGYAASLESLFDKFPKELAKTYSGYFLMAELQETQEKYDEASKSYQRSIAIKPDANHYAQLSRIYILMKKYDDSLKAADDGIKLEANCSYCYSRRAVALIHLNRQKDAVESLKKMLELSPDSDYLLESTDLKPLESNPEFKILLDSKKKNDENDELKKLLNQE